MKSFITTTHITTKALTLSTIMALATLTGCQTGSSNSSSSADDIVADTPVNDTVDNQGYYTTASGLKYKSLASTTDSNAKSPIATDNVTVNYRGTLTNGTVFDSGQSVSFPLNRVIKGWTEGLQLMKEGDKFEFYIPAELAYGSSSVAGIPANSPLVFTVELLSVNR